MRKELAQDVVAAQNVDFVSQKELLRSRVQYRITASDTCIIDLTRTILINLNALGADVEE